jgi:hypothetical protein
VYLYDSSSHYTHFTGFMLEEEIVASLWVLIARNLQNHHRLTVDTENCFCLINNGEWKGIHLVLNFIKGWEFLLSTYAKF